MNPKIWCDYHDDRQLKSSILITIGTSPNPHGKNENGHQQPPDGSAHNPQAHGLECSARAEVPPEFEFGWIACRWIQPVTGVGHVVIIGSIRHNEQVGVFWIRPVDRNSET